MSGVFAVFSALTKNWMRSKTGVFFSILFPVMLLLLFGTVFGGGENMKYTLYVQNLDLKNGAPTDLSKAFVDALNNTGVFDIKYLAPDVNVTSYVKGHPSFSSYKILIIPRGFQSNAVNGSIFVRISITVDTLNELLKYYGGYMNQSVQTNIKEGIGALKGFGQSFNRSANVIILLDESDSSSQIVKGVLYSVVDAFNNRLIGSKSVILVSSMNLTGGRLKAIDYYLPGYIAAFIMTNGVIGVTSTVSEFRRNGIIKRLAATPLGKGSWILANLLQQTLLAFLLTVVMIMLGWMVFGITLIPDFWSLLLIFIGSVAFCSVGIVLGGIIKDVETAYGVSNSIAFPLMFLSGAFWPVDIMPEYLQVVARMLPLYYFHQGLRALLIFNDLSGAYLSFIILGVMAIVFMLFAMKVTQWKEFE